MASVEHELISNIIEGGSWKEVHSAGVSASYFLSEETREVFSWIAQEVKYDAQVPSKKRVLRQFPAFEFSPSRNPVPALIRELRANNIRAAAFDFLEEALEGLDDGEDPESVVQMLIPHLRDSIVEFADSGGSLMAQSGDEQELEYVSMRDAGGIIGTPYPWEPLNDEGGIQNGQFVVIFARPKMMKTWVACKICTAAYIEQGKRVAVYSKEMTVSQMRRRCISIITGLDDRKIRTGRLSEEEEDIFFDALHSLEDFEDEYERDGRKPAMLFLSDKGIKGGSTVTSLRARIEKFDPDILLIDGFYLMRDARSGKKDREWKTVGNVSADIKELAIDLDIAIIGTCQANRDSMKNTTGSDLADIAYADAIGQDADLVMQVVKAKAPEGHPILMFLFPGSRDGDIPPFVINANPGKDFSLRQRKVNVKGFFEEAKRCQEDEEEARTGGGAGTSQQSGSTKPKSGAKKKRSRLRA